MAVPPPALFFVDDVFAAETGDRRDRWLFSKNDDGPDRFVYKLTYFDGSGNAKQDLYFRERTFGVLARIEIRPADAADAQSGRIDLRLRISKATMLPESAAGSDGGGTRFFTFDFFFRHNAANGAFAPSIDIAARGWAFIGGLSTTKPWTLYEWIKEGRGAIPVSDAKPVAGDKTGLAARFAASIFGPIVEPGNSELCFLPQLNPDDRFLWRIKTAGEEKRCRCRTGLDAFQPLTRQKLRQGRHWAGSESDDDRSGLPAGYLARSAGAR
ncbi:hypothetical protein LZK76_02895 [Rhizobium leguminosarum]|nr:hypothetical protein LZK76_02895 [Rhizobium leguminosarum]